MFLFSSAKAQFKKVENTQLQTVGEDAILSF